VRRGSPHSLPATSPVKTGRGKVHSHVNSFREAKARGPPIYRTSPAAFIARGFTLLPDTEIAPRATPPASALTGLPPSSSEGSARRLQCGDPPHAAPGARAQLYRPRLQRLSPYRTTSRSPTAENPGRLHAQPIPPSTLRAEFRSLKQMRGRLENSLIFPRSLL